MMEEELSNTPFDNFLNFGNSEQSLKPLMTPLVEPQSDPQPLHLEQKMKAYNPYEMFENYESPMRQIMINHFLNKKFFSGIQVLFGIKKYRDESDQFFHSIDANIFNSSQNNFSLHNLFQLDENQEQKQRKEVDALTEKLSTINMKTFQKIGMKKIMQENFEENFDNFIALKDQSSFSSFLINSLEEFLEVFKNTKTHGTSSIIKIYEFWMTMFSEFIRQIWKHNATYSLNLFKKCKNCGQAQNSCGNSTVSSSSFQNDDREKEKRKSWSNSEIQFLNKIIDSNVVFSQARLQEISQELNRSVSSISSKVVKLSKNRKLEVGEKKQKGDLSIEDKIKQILEKNKKGFTKEEVIGRMNQEYEMGVDENWKKSVASLLSSSQEIQKIKPMFRLTNPSKYFGYLFDNSIKDKVIQCIMNLPSYCGEVKDICLKYCELFKINTPDLKSNISKTLQRYNNQIFEKDSSKVQYKLSNCKNFLLEDIFT